MNNFYSYDDYITEYLYHVIFSDGEDSFIDEDYFDNFEEAKTYARSAMSRYPKIGKIMVIRNSNGECTESHNEGVIWSWEDEMSDILDNDINSTNVFTKGDFTKYADGYDPENDPEFDDRDITFETDCVACEHPLDEEYYGAPRELASYVDDVISHLFFDLGKNFIDYEDFNGEVLDVLERWYSDELGLEEYDGKCYENWCDAVFCEVARQLTDNRKFSKVKHLYINESLTESAEPLATNKRGDYIVVANSGRGYTVFNKHDVVIGGFDGEDDDEAVKRFNLGDINESCRKPIPEGKSIKDLVEEMEENEDMVECKWCDELFDKSDCRYEVDMGWLCPQCIEAIKSRGEELTFRENVQEAAASKKATTNIYDIFDDGISLYYDGLEATVCYDQRDADWWSEKEYISDEFEYNITFEDFADLVCDLDSADYNKFITQYPEVLEDEDSYTTSELWVNFVKDNAEELMAKHNEYIFKFYKDDARDAFEEWAYNDFNEHRYDGPDPDEERDRYLDRYGWD